MIEQQTLSKIYLALGIIGFFVLYKLLNRPEREFQKEIDKVLTDDKHKAKGQYDYLKQ